MHMLASIPFQDMDGGQIIGFFAVAGGALFLIIGTIARSARMTAINKEREQSRREIAAYVAEGSMSPEQAERLLAAGEKPRSSCG